MVSLQSLWSPPNPWSTSILWSQPTQGYHLSNGQHMPLPQEPHQDHPCPPSPGWIFGVKRSWPTYQVCPTDAVFFHLDSSGISLRLPLSTISRSDLSGTGGVKMNWPTHQECLSGELFQISPHQDQPCPLSPGWICGG